VTQTAQENDSPGIDISLSFPCPIADCSNGVPIQEIDAPNAATIGFKKLNNDTEIHTIIDGSVTRFSPVLNNINQSKFVVHNADEGIRVTYLFSGDMKQGLQPDISIEKGEVVGEIHSSDKNAHDLEIYIELPQNDELQLTPSNDGKYLLLENNDERK